MLRRALTCVLAAFLSLSALLVTEAAAQAAPVTVTNATQFTDTTSAVVHAHGGRVIKVGSYYYWFSENRNPDNTFKAVEGRRLHRLPGHLRRRHHRAVDGHDRRR